MEMGEARVEMFGSVAAVPVAAVGLLGQEVLSVAGGVVIMEFVGGDFLPGGTEKIVLPCFQRDIAKAHQLPGVPAGAAEGSHHVRPGQLVQQIQKSAALGNAGQALLQGGENTLPHGFVPGQLLCIQLRVAAA